MIRKSLLVLSVLFISLFSQAESVDSLVHDPSGYIDDFAGLYTPQEKQQLGAIVKSFFDTVQIAVVTIKTLNGVDKQEFATKLFNKWGVGSKSNNGLLLLICYDEHKAFAATGKAIQGDLTDLSAAGLMRGVMVPEFKQGHKYEGTRKLLLAYIDKLSPSAKEFKAKQDEAKIKQFKQGLSTFFYWVIGIIILVIVGYLVIRQISKIEEAKEKKRFEEEALNDEYIKARKALSDLSNISLSVHNSLLNLAIQQLLNKNQTTNPELQIEFLRMYKHFMDSKSNEINEARKNSVTLSDANQLIAFFDGKKIAERIGVIAHHKKAINKLVLDKNDYSDKLSKLQQYDKECKVRVERLKYQLNEKNISAMKALSASIFAYNNSFESISKELYLVVSNDTNKVSQVKNAYNSFKNTLDDLAKYCDKPEVSQNSRDSSRLAINSLRKKIENYNSLDIFTQYLLYTEFQELLYGSHAQSRQAKYEYDVLQAELKKKRQREQDEINRKNKLRQEEEERERMRRHSSYSSYGSSGFDTFGSSSPSSSSDAFGSSDSGSIFGGGSTDGGGGGVDSW